MLEDTEQLDCGGTHCCQPVVIVVGICGDCEYEIFEGEQFECCNKKIHKDCIIKCDGCGLKGCWKCMTHCDGNDEWLCTECLEESEAKNG